jgi:hypothetical protein
VRDLSRRVAAAVIVVAALLVFAATGARPGLAAEPGCWFQPGCMIADEAYQWEIPPYVLTFDVEITWQSRVDVTVHFSTQDLTAVAGRDYVPVDNGTIVVPAGATVGHGQVRLIPQAPLTQDKTFQVTIFNASSGVITVPQAVMTIKAGLPSR